MVPTYAVPADLTASPWNITVGTEEEEGEAERLLAYAFPLIRRATASAVYTADPTTGLPVDTTRRDAFRDAACAQVAAWVALDVNPTGGSAGAGDGVAVSKSIGSASIQYASPAATVAARARSATTLDAHAFAILTAAGLTNDYPVVTG